jgi:peptide/nickel transport system substrate-binding protein
MTRRLVAGVAAALALALLPGRAAAGLRPAYGREVRIALPALPRTADPARALEPADLALARAVHATLLEVDARGALAPALLAEVPAPEAGGRAFRLRLRPGLRFADGTPLGAAEVASSLARLLAREPASPHAWVALPILGADALLDGRAVTLPGVQVLSSVELLVTLAFPLPEFPWALAALPSAVVSRTGAGAGPFQIAAQDGRTVRLAPNLHHARGRPFADALLLVALDARGAARALAAGEVALVLRPEAAGPGALAAPPLVALVAAVSSRRLGAGAEPVRRALAALDRAELVRLFARGPAAPLRTLVPPAAGGAGGVPEPAAAGAAGAPPPRIALLVPAEAGEPRAVAERIQVKLFDRGVRAAVEPEPRERFAARLAAGDADVALVAVPVLALRPALAAGQIALATRGPAAARRAMSELAGLAPEAAAARTRELARALDLVPLLTSGQRITPAPSLQGAAPGPDGGLAAGDLWLAPAGPP